MSTIKNETISEFIKIMEPKFKKIAVDVSPVGSDIGYTQTDVKNAVKYVLGPSPIRELKKIGVRGMVDRFSKWLNKNAYSNKNIGKLSEEVISAIVSLFSKKAQKNKQYAQIINPLQQSLSGAAKRIIPNETIASKNEELEKNAKGEELYGVTDETGEQLVERAHPGGGTKTELTHSKTDENHIETIVEQQEKDLEVARKIPKGVYAELTKFYEELKKSGYNARRLGKFIEAKNESYGELKNILLAIGDNLDEAGDVKKADRVDEIIKKMAARNATKDELMAEMHNIAKEMGMDNNKVLRLHNLIKSLALDSFSAGQLEELIVAINGDPRFADINDVFTQAAKNVMPPEIKQFDINIENTNERTITNDRVFEIAKQFALTDKNLERLDKLQVLNFFKNWPNKVDINYLKATLEWAKGESFNLDVKNAIENILLRIIKVDLFKGAQVKSASEYIDKKNFVDAVRGLAVALSADSDDKLRLGEFLSALPDQFDQKELYDTFKRSYIYRSGGVPRTVLESALEMFGGSSIRETGEESPQSQTTTPKENQGVAGKMDRATRRRLYWANLYNKALDDIYDDEIKKQIGATKKLTRNDALANNKNFKRALWVVREVINTFGGGFDRTKTLRDFVEVANTINPKLEAIPKLKQEDLAQIYLAFMNRLGSLNNYQLNYIKEHIAPKLAHYYERSNKNIRDEAFMDELEKYVKFVDRLKQ